MEKAIAAWRDLALPEFFSFLLKSGLMLLLSAFILYYLLGATYPPLHDTLHHFRHSLAVVPCH